MKPPTFSTNHHNTTSFYSENVKKITVNLTCQRNRFSFYHLSMNQHGLSARRMRRRGGCFLTPRSRGSAFFVRGRSPNKYFKQALNVRRGGGVNFLTPCTPTYVKMENRRHKHSHCRTPNFSVGKFRVFLTSLASGSLAPAAPLSGVPAPNASSPVLQETELWASPPEELLCVLVDKCGVRLGKSIYATGSAG